MSLISRKEAKALGLTQYDSAHPCKAGHFGKREVINCVCLECKKISYTKWQTGAKGMAYRAKEMVRYREQPKNRMLSRVKTRAGIKGIEFDLTINDIKIPNECPVLGIPLLIANGYRLDNSPSIDRVDSSKGYIRGNIKIISWRANKIKSDATADELLAIAAYMKQNA
jgi:hypothetical protein